MRLMILLAASLVVAAPPLATQSTVGLSDDDVAAINEFMASYLEAVRGGDWDAWLQLWADDVVYMPPNSPAIEGLATLREATHEYPLVEDASITVDEIDGRADLAFVRGKFLLTIPTHVGAEPITDVGKFLIILRKAPDGIWQAAIECYNSDLSLPSMEGEHVEGEEQT